MSGPASAMAGAVDDRLLDLERRVARLEDLVLPPARGASEDLVEDPLRAGHNAFRRRARERKEGQDRG